MRFDPLNNKAPAAAPEETAGAIPSWLADEPDMFSRFLALSGLQPGQLRSVIDDPGFLGGMIDFLMSHEPTLMAFCEATETRLDTVAAASHYYSKPALDSGDY